MITDITFCSSDCINEDCFRHPSQLAGVDIMVSNADFSLDCDEYIPPTEDNPYEELNFED